MDIKNCVMTDQYKRIQGAKLKLQNKTIPVYKGVNTVGRNKAAIINLKNVNVSQHHALIIIVDDTQHFISDLNSSNGTYLLDTRLAPFKLYELSNEMEVKFGDEVASYLKMPNLSTTVHLETETMEMTQNVTQNFYAATTQLMFDNLSLNQTRLSSLPHESIPNKDTQDIHEAVTQVVPYPSSVEENVLVEPVNDDIHEAPTQVVVFIPQPSTSRATRDTTIQKNGEEDVHEMPTQIVEFPQEKLCSSNKEGNEETELILAETNKNINKNVTPVATSDSNKSNNSSFHLDGDSFTNNGNHSDADSSVIQDSIIETTVMEEREENVRAIIGNEVIVNGDSNGSMDFLTMPFDAEVIQFNGNANMADDKKSTTSESQDIGQPRRRLPRKLSSSEELSENQNNPKVCNSDSDTDIDDADHIENVKKEKLRSEAQTNNKAYNSDSETNIEDDLPKINKKRLKPVQSDSETDVEDEVLHNLSLTQSEDIVKPKVLSKKSIFNSDSETEVEGNKERDPMLEAAEDGDSNATEILNDTDCIPATQDAFADMFQYKNAKLSHSSHSQNVSSEESFKLGLTELMNDSENNQSVEQIPTGDSNSVNQKQNFSSSNTGEKNTEGLNMTSKQESNDKVECGKTDEDIYLMPTQKLKSKIVSDSTNTKNTDDLYMMATQKIDDEEKLATASTSGITNIERDAEEDLYMMPTQKIKEVKIYEPSNKPSTSKMISNAEKEADEDIYMMPTQKFNESEPEFKTPAKKFTFKKKATNLEGSLTNILSSKQEEDPYLMATQKINETEDDNEDDIYMQPTQKLENNSQNTQKTQSMQDLNSGGPNASETKEDQTEEDLYMAPTQQINQNSMNALYMLETQKIDSEPNLDNVKTSRNELVEKDDVYDLPTQPLSHALEAEVHTHEKPTPKGQVETFTSGKHLLVTNQDSPRRKRMKKSDLESLKRTIESKEKIDDAETLSQIDTFVKKPLEKRETEDNDRVETLSQIDAFVKEPFENAPKEAENSGKSKILLEDRTKNQDGSDNEAPIKKPHITSLPKANKHLPSKKSISVSVNQKEEEEIDRPETLSQIESFVKKPLDAKLPEKFTRVSRTRQSTKPSEEDLYMAPTQEIIQDLVDEKIMNKSEVSREMVGTKEPSNTELYMLETQKIDSQSHIEAGKIPQNNKKSPPHTVGHEESVASAKSLEDDIDIPKRKRMKKSDTENLRKNVDSKNEAEDIDRPETLSQIDAFIKKPLNVVASKSRKLAKIHEEPSTSSSEKSDQIKQIVKQPGKSKDVSDFEKPEISSRVSRTRHSTRILGEENKQEISKSAFKSESTDQTKPQKSNEASTEKLEVPNVDLDKNVSTSSSDPDTIRSDVDQSFALLEAKSTKTRKSNRITNVGEIKVAKSKNRRSMTTTSIPDFSKTESRPTTRKSRNVDNNVMVTAPEFKVIDISKRTTGKGTTARRKSGSSDSDFLESEIAAKKSKVSLVGKGKRKASVAEDIDKASTTSEESIREIPSKILKTSDAGKVKGKTVPDDIDKPSTSSEESNREGSSKTPRASVANTRGKAKATVADDIDRASTIAEESNRASSKAPRASAARSGKAKATVADDIDKASAIAEESNTAVSSKTPRASVANRGKAKATVADDIDKGSATSEESSGVSSKTPKASMARRGRGKSIAKDDIDKMSTASEESIKGKELATPSTSRARASSRLTIFKNSEDNKSSESGSAQDPSMATPSRRGRKNVPDNALLISPERSKRKQRPKVVFTMMDDPQLESLIRQLGGSVVDSVDASTVLVTEHVKRSQKLLTAVGQGKPVCSPNWIRASKKANEFLDPWEFILTDKEAESKWKFSLKESISKAANEKLLVNYSFQLLVSNATDVLKGAIESCGGKCVTRNPPKNAEGFYVVVAAPENKNKYIKIKKQSPEVIIVEPEAIFDGVLRQDLRLGRHLLT